MTHLMTHYTTYDQAYYYADLKRLPRLSEAQRRSLLSQLSTAASPSLRASLTEQLVESYLPFATAIAIQLCPLSRFQRDLPDLIGVANLTVVEVLSRRERTHLDEPTSYLAAWIRGRVRGTLAQGLVTMPYQARVRAREQGETDQAYALAHMLSLDEPREWFESGEMEEPLVTPLLPSGAAPARDPQQRAQVETWLSYLSPRAQAILRLRYGLSDDNERSHTPVEIARLLGLDRRVVKSIERDALLRVRALAMGQATIGQQNGRACIRYPDAHNNYAMTPEQEAVLRQAALHLHAQGVPVTGRALAQATGDSVGRAYMFLRLHQREFPPEVRARPYDAAVQEARAAQRQQKLEHAWTRLEAQGVRVTSPVLAKEARVGKPAAIAFLKARRSLSHAAS